MNIKQRPTQGEAVLLADPQLKHNLSVNEVKCLLNWYLTGAPSRLRDEDQTGPMCEWLTLVDQNEAYCSLIERPGITREQPSPIGHNQIYLTEAACMLARSLASEIVLVDALKKLQRVDVNYSEDSGSWDLNANDGEYVLWDDLAKVLRLPNGSETT